MILILTTESGDYSHLKIVDWLIYKNSDFIILTGESLITGEKKLDIIDGEVFLDDINLTKNVSCVFYRQWFTKSNYINTKDAKLNENLNHNLFREVYEIRNFLHSNLKKAKWYPDPFNIYVNKIENLGIAKSVNLEVPDFVITNRKNTLEQFYLEKNGEIITKAIGNFRDTFSSENMLVNSIYTKKVSQEHIDNLPERFIPSFFQKRIKKKFEYRVLYFNRECFSAMILSQSNDSTKVDSRIRTDGEAKLVPVNLPLTLTRKVVDFMNKANLNIGCIDILHSEDEKYYFLEVNPVGQFGGYSQRCFLQFEEKLVHHLIKIDNEYKAITRNN